MNITFIGLGIMGSRMAANLLQTGNELTVWNRTKGKAETLKKMGAREAVSLTDSVKDADIVFTMLAAPEAVEKVATGPVGFLSKAKKNTLWINTSTINPSFAEEMSLKAGEAGLRYLDAPVSGSKIPAEKGELIFLVGGENQDLEQARPMLSKMGKSIHHIGKVGMGSSMKMVVNLVLAQSMLAFSEAIALGKASGIAQEILFNTLLGGPLTPAYLQGKREKLEKNNYEPEFPLKWAHKDLHLIMQTAYEQQIALPLTSITKEIYAMAKAEGKGENDISAICSWNEKQL
jgi:3-hydroxyisobutyrate dehydrogenase-like beta-hydroxyacid dehydrogenase